MKLRKTDILFSRFIRSRDTWTCQRCFTRYSPENAQGLDCSHFWGRAKESTRFEPNNCCALCRGCHQYFTSYPAEHTEFWKKRIGEKEFKLLQLQAFMPKKRDDKLTLLWLEKLLKYDPRQ